MNNKEIRQFIVAQVEEGKKFTEIAAVLKSDYGITKSRQSVHAIYKRAINKNKSNTVIEEEQILVRDIINIHVRGYNMHDVSHMIKLLDHSDKSYPRVSKIIKDNKELYEEVLNRLIIQTTSLIINNAKIEDIKANLQYKGIDISEKGLIDILAESYKKIIKSKVINYAADAYSMVPNNELVKKIRDLSEITIQLSDVKEVVKKI